MTTLNLIYSTSSVQSFDPHSTRPSIRNRRNLGPHFISCLIAFLVIAHIFTSHFNVVFFSILPSDVPSNMCPVFIKSPISFISAPPIDIAIAITFTFASGSDHFIVIGRCTSVFRLAPFVFAPIIDELPYYLTGSPIILEAAEVRFAFRGLDETSAML